MNYHVMTVKELIEELTKCPMDYPVHLDGFDDVGDAGSVEINEFNKWVIINRAELM